MFFLTFDNYILILMIYLEKNSPFYLIEYYDSAIKLQNTMNIYVKNDIFYYLLLHNQRINLIQYYICVMHMELCLKKNQPMFTFLKTM